MGSEAEVLQTEIRYLRDRVHSIASDVQVHRSETALHKHEIARLVTDMADVRETLSDTMVTKEALTSSVQLVMAEMRSQGRDLELVKRAVFGATAIVVTAVIVAVVAVVVR